MIFSAIIGGSVAIQPIVGWAFDSVKSIRLMNFVNILVMIGLSISVAILGPRTYQGYFLILGVLIIVMPSY